MEAFPWFLREAEPSGQSEERIGDYVRPVSAPTVVSPRHVEEARRRVGAGGDAERRCIEQWVGGFSLGDDRTAAALRVLLDSLSERSSRRAFFINGPFGAGKSHLLLLLALISETPPAAGALERPFVAAIPDSGRGLSPRLAVPLSLDDHPATETRLEAIVWQAADESLRRLGGRPANQGDRATGVASRAERLQRLLKAARSAGRSGVVFLVDELSMYLAAKGPAAVEEDAAFLHFIGRQGSRYPVWFIAALQKDAADVGPWDAYSLRQVGERFGTPLSLGLGHVGSLLRRRLAPAKDEQRLRSLTARLATLWRQRLPRLDWGADDLFACYPLHPATVDLLQTAGARFLSRTRSAVQFVQAAVSEALHHPVEQLVTAEQPLAHFATELSLHPELGTLVQQALPSCLQTARREAADEHPWGERLARLLVWSAVAGRPQTPLSAAHALLVRSGLPPGGDYGYVTALLERLRRRGDYIVVRRSADGDEDEYSVDSGRRLQDEVRRRLHNARARLRVDDGRASASALAGCQGEEWPLHRLERPHTETVWWRCTPRVVGRRRGAALADAELLNLQARLSAPGCETDVELLIGDPLDGPAGGRRFAALASSVHANRRAGRVVWVAPAELTGDDREVLVERAAVERALADPGLADSRRGRAVRTHLEDELRSLTVRIQPILIRAYGHGDLQCDDGRQAATETIVRGSENWRQWTARIAGWALDALHPDFAAIAPRERLSAAVGVNRLIQAILAGRTEDELDATAMRAWRSVAAPLGLRWRRGRLLAPPELRHALLSIWRDPECSDPAPAGGADEGPPWIELHRCLGSARKRSAGWASPQTALVAAALLRSGDLQAADACLQPLPVHRLTAPLEDGVFALAPASPCPPAVEQRAGELICRLRGEPAEADAGINELWESLRTGCRQLIDEVELAQTRLAQIQRLWSQSADRWTRWREAVVSAGRLAASLPTQQDAENGLAAAAAAAGEELSWWDDWQSARAFFTRDFNLAILVRSYLQHPDLRLTGRPELQRLRERLLARCAEGEGGMADFSALTADWRTFVTSYRDAYLAHHQRVHGDPQFSALKALLEDPRWLVLQRLESLGAAPLASFHGLHASLRRELTKSCQAAGLARDLEVFPACPHCHLRLGETIDLQCAAHFLASLQDCWTAAVRWFADPNIRRRLERGARWLEGAPAQRYPQLLDALTDGRADDCLLTPEILRAMRTALTCPATSVRSLSTLNAALADRVLPRRQVLEVVERWLDADEPLGEEEPVRVIA